jgi:hypothetical protein
MEGGKNSGENVKLYALLRADVFGTLPQRAQLANA